MHFSLTPILMFFFIFDQIHPWNWFGVALPPLLLLLKQCITKMADNGWCITIFNFSTNSHWQPTKTINTRGGLKTSGWNKLCCKKDNNFKKTITNPTPSTNSSFPPHCVSLISNSKVTTIEINNCISKYYMACSNG